MSRKAAKQTHAREKEENHLLYAQTTLYEIFFTNKNAKCSTNYICFKKRQWPRFLRRSKNVTTNLYGAKTASKAKIVRQKDMTKVFIKSFYVKK